MSGTTPEPANPVSTEPSMLTRYTYKYHNDSITTLNILLLGLVLLITILGFFILVQIGTEPKPIHFKLNQDKQIIPSVPMDQEGITTPALLNWVNEFVMKAFSYNYSNIDKQTARLTPYFSDAAIKIYNDLLANDEDFKNVVTSQFVVSVIPSSAPEIVVGQAFKGRYAWQIEIPVTFVFSNAVFKATQQAVLDFLVWRVPPTEAELGVNVATFTHKVVGRTGIVGVRSRI